MRILITGSSGQLGTEVARQLSAEHQTIGIDVVPGEWTDHVMSITERDAVFALVKDTDAIIHIASLHAPHAGEYSKQSFIDINISGTLHSEELCRHFALSMDMPTICLRTSRFFDQPPELMATYRLYRGVDVRDVAAAHLLAVTNPHITFDIFNISARPPFLESDTPGLLRDAAPVLQHYYPTIAAIFS